MSLATTLEKLKCHVKIKVDCTHLIRVSVSGIVSFIGSDFYLFMQKLNTSLFPLRQFIKLNNVALMIMRERFQRCRHEIVKE